MDSSEEGSDVNENEEDQPEEERISITIDVSPALYAKIEAAAAEDALSISEYLERIVEESVSARGHPVTLEAIERLRRLREKIFLENNGQFFEDSSELLYQQREERIRQQMANHEISPIEEGMPFKNSERTRGHPITREAIERLRQIREAIMQDRDGEPFEDSAEIIRQMREERSRELGEL